jgi:hypothetical protein
MADIRAAYDTFAKLAVSFINEMDEEFMPKLLAINMAEEPGQIKDLVPFPPELVLMLEGSDDGLTPFVRRLFAGTSKAEAADLVVYITESWVVNGSDGCFDKDVVEGRVAVRNHPKRVEALMVAVHTPERTYLGTCPIQTTDGKRRAVFEPIDLTGVAEGYLAMCPENPVKH